MMPRLSAKNFAGLGAPILALGMAVLAFYNYRSWLEQRTGYTFSILDDRWVLFVGLALAGIGGLLVVVWLMALVLIDVTYPYLRIILKKLTKIERKVNSLTLLPCEYGDLEAISKLANAEFGDLAADYSRNQVLWGID
jgi:hypothetical protein